MKYFFTLSVALLLFSACNNPNTNKTSVADRLLPDQGNEELTVPAPKTLKGTTWNSEFYYYHNFYHFQTDSSGFFEDGQVAWSSGIDIKRLNIPEDKILYSGKQTFTYSIKDQKLKLVYKDENKGLKDRTFSFRSEYKDWISDYEYTYGHEVLQEGEKAELFTAVPKTEK